MKIERNTTGFVGGGVALVLGGRMQLERFNFEECERPARCTTISDNLLAASSFSAGSAIFVGADFELRLIGADERRPLFADGFASGGTGA